MANDRFDHVFVEPTSLEASLAFYRDALGWSERFSWASNDEPRGVFLASPGGAAIVPAAPYPAGDRSKSHGINGTRPTLYLMVDDIEARHAELAAMGAAMFAPEATHWGTRWFVARDPDGDLIAFEQRL